MLTDELLRRHIDLEHRTELEIERFNTQNEKLTYNRYSFSIGHPWLLAVGTKAKK